MSPPEPRINTFFQKTTKPIIEPISKIFMIASLILGINRLPLIGIINTAYIVIMLTYTAICNMVFLYFILKPNLKENIWASVTLIDYVQYFICTVLGFILHKRLINFYLNLNKFDKAIGIKMTTFGIREAVYNFLQLTVTLLQSCVMYMCYNEIYINLIHLTHVIPIKLLNCFELHYYGHLFSLMLPRLRALSNCMNNTYPNKKNRNRLTNPSANELQKQKNKSRHVDMNILMDFYNNIIVAYDYLNDAVKWQILTLLISIFSATLFMLYNLVKTIIWGDVEKKALIPASISFLIVQLFPLLVPCVFADRVQKEVRLIKDFLACKLYENTLDKQSRSTARSLLALIETRNLSFSLFHMFDIDNSLPFKFLALLLTYLIILLQFDKVISPNKPS